MGAGGGALPPGHAPAAQGPSGPPVSGRVVLAASLQARASGARALYVIARPAGTRDIVAVKKIDQPTFPAAFELSGADAMVPGTAFTGPFDLTVRLSKSGDAIPAAGDLEGSAKGVAAGTKDVSVALDTVRQ
jgi:cytochrome c-type biogenesis protein CcmH